IVKKPKKKIETFTPFITKIRYFLGGFVFSSLVIFLPLLTIIFLQDLPNPKLISLSPIPQTTKIYDRNKTLLFQIYSSQDRTLIPLSDVPKNLQNATIAIEDKEFYNHPGFDVSAILRSALSNASGKNLQGGSTITQQLVKTTLLTPETSLTRKVKEIILAFWTERIYDKDEILEMYFNQVPYGGTAWGIESASELYFHKKTKDLTLAESAFLASIPRAPSIYSPYGTTPTAWEKRHKDVLARMETLGYITKRQRLSAEKVKLSFYPPQNPIHAPHFSMYIKDLLVKKYGLPMVEKGGLTVITSLDLSLQGKTQEIVADEVAKNAYLNLGNGASLVTNPKNGDILAMVGSKDFSEPNFGKVNLTTSLRQPGSSIKVVTYTAALLNGFTAATILEDTPITYVIPGSASYSPVNYDGRFHGRVPLRIAFGNSFNIPAVKALQKVGVPAMVDLGKKMGIESWGQPDQYGLSITLGAAETTMLDMATVYGTVANEGGKVVLNPILKITDSKGNVIEEKSKEPKGVQIIDKAIAFIVSNILQDNAARTVSFGPNSLLSIPDHTVSVKTGTSDNKRDNWAIGYTKDRVVTVWVGNNDNTPMSQYLASGVTGATPIWNRVMQELLKEPRDEQFTPPANIVQKPCLGRIEFFLRGTENSTNCVYLPPAATPSATLLGGN
ncbi:MAG: transglycosylase domain-containing protein, partial [bacterium]|nr:transglycosylase domain-containing protein [bacterium]